VISVQSQSKIHEFPEMMQMANTKSTADNERQEPPGPPVVTRYPDIFAGLSEPFDGSEIKERPQGGRKLSYITARTAMSRFDLVVGPENWWDEYTVLSDTSVLCKLSIRLPDGMVVTKQDVGGAAGMSDSGDDDKSTFSDAYKRAAVKFGVGRHLYQDGYVMYGANGEAWIEGKGPSRPVAASTGSSRSNGASHASNAPAASGGPSGPPRSGKAIYPWSLSIDRQHGFAEGTVIKHLNGWAKMNGLPFKSTEWPDNVIPGAVREALEFAMNKSESKRFADASPLDVPGMV
jgi:hypothetical protein